MENHPLHYDIDAIGQDIVHFEDFIDSSFYLIQGADRALLIDTGCGGGNVRRLASAFTDKEIDLAVTHAHGDHDAHAGEFDRVYMHRADIELRRAAQLCAPAEKRLDVDRFLALEDGALLDLGGGAVVRTLHIPGHTPGSVAFVDEAHKAVFTGDAIGSGMGVWMQLPGCCTVSEYKAALLHFATELYPYRDYRFLGGHYRQADPPYSKAHNPVCMQMVEDMIRLCDEMLAGRAQDAVFAGRAFGDEQPHIASCGTAAMVYLPSRVR